VPKVLPIVLPHLVLATLIFWFLCLRAERKAATHSPVADASSAPDPGMRVNLLRALVPLLPLVLLFLAGPPVHLIRVPERWLVVPGKSDMYYETRLIGAAMLVGVLAAALAHPTRIRGVPKAFFDGAGYAFAEVISLIVTASCFGKAVDLIGLAELIGQAIQQAPGLLLPVAAFVPLSFATLSGSGMAATQSLYGFFVEPAEALGADPKEVGAVVSIGAAAGRTMSPVAAVALMSAKLSGTNSFELARRVAGPLLISLAIIIALKAVRII
jgi:DcuC family C4-dicarboxylate transporter